MSVFSKTSAIRFFLNLKKSFHKFVYSSHLVAISIVSFFTCLLLILVINKHVQEPLFIFWIYSILLAGVFWFGLIIVLYLLGISKKLESRVKRTESHLFETEQVYKRIVEQANDLIYILDLEMNVLLLNHHAVDVFARLVKLKSQGGNTPDDADLKDMNTYIGKRLDGLFRPTDWGFVESKIETLISKNQPLSYEQAVRTIRGKRVLLNTTLTPISDDKGKIINILGISRDVTAKMEVEQRMYQTEKLASIGTLAAGVAHEINNPLAIILGFSDLLLERFEKGSPEYEDLKMIEYNGLVAKKVVENLLGFSRVTEIKQVYIEVQYSINLVLKIMDSTLNKKNILLKTSIEENLPLIQGDAREFQQVILNLVNNAIAAMRDKGSLEITAHKVGDVVEIKIKDTGSGISNSVSPRIFDPFFSTKKEGEGTGLGLWLSYGIIKKYGGTISFKSISNEDYPGKQTGTTFKITVPVSEIEEV